MATTSNTYTGNGSNKLFSITFPYLDTTDVDVYLNGTLQTITTQYTFANATTIEFVAAPGNGAVVLLDRSTDDATLQATFFPGSSIKAADLNLDFDQVLYIAQETSNEATTATSTAASATTTANTALSQSSAAVSTANTASSNASAAVSTANTASTNASNAVTTANSAVSTANTATTTANAAVSTANTASSNASAAVSTANTASSNASAAVSTANTASSNATAAVSTANTASSNASTAVSTANGAVTTANNAVTTANSAQTAANNAVVTSNLADSKANQAIAAVAASINYTLVANVAAIPASPANGTYIEVADSTGIQSFTPLVGLPGGFVGDSGLTVRLVYQTSNTSWNWLTYFANNSETRYLKLDGGTLTGALASTLGTAALPSLTFTGDTNTGIYSPGADQIAISTGGTARLTTTTTGITSALAVDVPLGAVGTPSITFTGDTNTGIYSPAADTLAFVEGGVEALRIDSSGRVGLGTSSVNAKLEISGNSGGRGLRLSEPSGEELDISAGAAANDPARIATSSGSGIAFAVNGTSGENVRIDSSGRLGIGTAVPSKTLHVYSTAFTFPARIETNGTGTGIELKDGTTGANPPTVGAIGDNFYITTANSERLRCDSSGRLLVGTSTARGDFFNGAGYTPRLQVEGTDFNGTMLSVTSNAVTNTNPNIILARSRGTNLGSSTLVANGDALGALQFQGADGTDLVVAASIIAEVDGTTGANDMPGRLVFSTTADGAASPTERMRITNAGNVGIGTALPGSLNSTGNQLVVGSGTGNQGLTIFAGSSSDSNIYFADGTAGTAPNIGYIQYRHASDRFDFGTNDTTRMSIDSSGRLLVGTSTAGSNELLQIQGVSGSSVAPGGLALKRSSVGNTDDIGFINFQNGSGNTFSQIKAICDGTPGASDYPGALTFSTTADGAASPAERFRISSTGAQFSVVPGGTTIYPQFACRAWVNFNGTGTVAIRASGNVSSITDNGTGLYTANFTTAMPDTNYTMMGTHSYMDSYRGGVVQFTQIATGGSSNTAFGGATQLTGSCAFRTVVNNAGATPNDPATVLVTFFR